MIVWPNLYVLIQLFYYTSTYYADITIWYLWLISSIYFIIIVIPMYKDGLFF